MASKTQVVDTLKQGYAAEAALIASLSDAELAIEGRVDRWGPKDVMAHIALWKERMLKNLEAIARGAAPVQYDNYQELNDADFEAHRDHAWTQIIEMSAQIHEALIADVEAKTEDALAATDVLPGREGTPLWQSILGSGYIHPMIHVARVYLRLGKRAEATQIEETTAQTLMALDDSPVWRGRTQYNLACHYALTGQKTRAIATLREALTLAPAFTEWSKQDPDFAAIRDDPAYKALYNA